MCAVAKATNVLIKMTDIDNLGKVRVYILTTSLYCYK